MPASLPPHLIDLLTQAETATIGHVLYDGFLERGIAPLLRGRRVAGTAVTLRLPHADSTLLHYAAGRVRPGDILVIDRGGDTKYACLGGGLGLALSLAGVVAAVIDGPATDLPELVEFNFPVWCRGLSPITTRLLGLDGSMNVPVSVGGQLVNPGDAVIADDQGVVVLPPGRAEAVARDALETQAREKAMHARLRAGEKLPDITGATAIVDAKLHASGT